ncbi:MAG: S8 family serine peptidase, partial [Litorivicinus sp.]
MKPIAVAWSAWAITGLAYASESCTDSELCWTRSTLAAEDAAAAGGGGLGGLGLGLGLAAALGGGGGGGSSAPVSSTQSQVSTPVLPPSTVASQSGFSATPNLAIAAGFETSEYQATRGLSAISASHVWSVGGLGAGTVVQVIDSGVDGSHAEFEGRVTQLIDHTGGDGADQRGHGTQMAGLIGAGRNGVGMVGVAPEASIVASKIFASGSSTTSQFNAWLPSALAQGRAAGATVVSNSWGSDAQID